MSSPKIFFSYSRLDSAFALRLARDIRHAGVDIWIDQLDITAGHHWDSAVEKALITSTCVLIILSPSSTASNNVKDEISFALDTGKKIIPVLLEECMAPFRLRRLQHIDFTKEYEEGLKQLLSTVRKNPVLAGKMNQPVLVEANGESSHFDSLSSGTDEDMQDMQLWDEACRIHTVAGYKEYLLENPTGEYKEEAALLIKQLEFEQKEDELEILLWQKAKTEQSLHLFQHYMQEYPEGRYKSLAVTAIEDLEKQERLDHLHHTIVPVKKNIQTKPIRKIFSRTNAIILGSILTLALVWGFAASVNPPEDQDQHAWKKASMQLDSLSMVHYLQAFPNGKYSPAAKHILDSFKLVRQFGLDSLHACQLQDSLATVLIAQDDSTTISSSTASIDLTTTEPKNKLVSKPKMQAKFMLGQPYQGGVIVYINPTGSHGLIVAEKEMDVQDYTAASKRCLGLKHNGYDDWRLPTKAELNWIFQCRKHLGPPTKGMYWTTTLVNASSVWGQDLWDGHSGNFSKDMQLNIKAVRSF